MNDTRKAWNERNRERIIARKRELYRTKHPIPMRERKNRAEDWREGLDTPMLDPTKIPKGMVQEWHEGAWRLIYSRSK